MVRLVYSAKLFSVLPIFNFKSLFHLLFWFSFKSKRSVLSLPASKILAVEESIDERNFMTVALENLKNDSEISNMCRLNEPVESIIDSKGVN